MSEPPTGREPSTADNELESSQGTGTYVEDFTSRDNLATVEADWVGKSRYRLRGHYEFDDQYDKGILDNRIGDTWEYRPDEGGWYFKMVGEKSENDHYFFLEGEKPETERDLDGHFRATVTVNFTTIDGAGTRWLEWQLFGDEFPGIPNYFVHEIYTDGDGV